MENKADLLKQFAVNVKMGTNPKTNEAEFHCPTCGSTVDFNVKTCPICQQTLAWKKILEDTEREAGFRLEGTVTVDLPSDYTHGDCRKCPFSFITKDANGNIYSCPITQNNSACPLVVKKIQV